VKFAIDIKPALDISTERAPEAKKLYIVGLDETQRTEIVEFLFGKSQSAEVVNLCIDFIAHCLGKYHILVAALEDIFSVEVGVFVEHHLVHIELIEVSIKQRYDARGKFHHNLLLPFLFSINIISQFY
jgi:hypothetical protein